MDDSTELVDVYGRPFDANDWFDETGNVDWDGLSASMHHQGSVSTGSYFVVRAIVWRILRDDIRDWKPWALVVSIEEARQKGALAMPDDLRYAYEKPLLRLVERALKIFAEDTDPLLARCLVALLALHKKLVGTAEFAMLADDEQKEMLGN